MDALVLRVIESLSEQIIHAPEFICMMYHKAGVVGACLTLMGWLRDRILCEEPHAESCLLIFDASLHTCKGVFGIVAQ